MSLRIGIDTGGTFTDLVVADGDRVRTVTKSLTTHDDLAAGLLRSLEKADLGDAPVGVIVHGTTVALNAILTRRGAEVGVITTTGYRDLLDMARGWRPQEALIDPRWRRPHELRPIVERIRRRSVDERVLATGDTLVELDEERLLTEVASLVADGCASVSVCFLHSYKHPGHERRAAELIRQHFPDLAVSTSSEIAPFPREYNRFSTCVLNAYVQPLMERYTRTLQARLTEAGQAAPLSFMTNDGGVATPDQVTTRPVTTLNSGPVGGVMGVQSYARRLEMPNLVGLDMGGTSTDVAVIVEGRAATQRELVLEHDILVSLPVLEIHSIGAGGGSIASVDAAGGINVGPESAGSDPGPACYRRGGTQPTVTDAFLLQGMLDPGAPLGGDEITPDVAAAEQAFGALAAPLGMDATELAGTVTEVAIHNMAEAARKLTIYRGVDPREFGLLAYGAAGPLVATQIARALEIPTVVIPALSGVFSAFGLLSASPFSEEVTPVMQVATPEVITEVFAQARAGAARVADTIRGRDDGEVSVECIVDATYLGQRWELAAVIDPGHDEPVSHLTESFGAAHERQFGYSLPAPIYVQTLRIRGVVATAHQVLPAALARTTPSAPRTTRTLTIAGQRHEEAPVYAADGLAAGQPIDGPAVIEAPTYTALLVPGDAAEVNDVGDVVVRIAEESR